MNARSVLTLTLLALGLSPMTVRAQPASGAPDLLWARSIADIDAVASREARPVLWLIHMEKEEACRRMVRTTYADPRVHARLKQFVLVAGAPSEADAKKLFPDLDPATVVACEAELRKRHPKEGTAVYVPRHVVSDAKGNVLARHDYELNVEKFAAFLDQALTAAGRTPPSPDEVEAAKPKPADPGSADAEPSPEMLRLINLIVSVPKDEKAAIADEFYERANKVDAVALVAKITAKAISSEDDRVTIIRRAGYDKHGGLAEAFLPLLSDPSKAVRQATVVTLEEMKSAIAAQGLLDLYAKEKDGAIRDDILRALGPAGVGSSAARTLLLEKVSGRGGPSVAAVMGIGSLLAGDKELHEALQKAFNKGDKDVKLATLYAYWIARDLDSKPHLEEIKQKSRVAEQKELAEVVLATIEDREPDLPGSGDGGGRGGRGGGRGGFRNNPAARLFRGFRPLFERDKMPRNRVRDIERMFGGGGR